MINASRFDSIKSNQIKSTKNCVYDVRALNNIVSYFVSVEIGMPMFDALYYECILHVNAVCTMLYS